MKITKADIKQIREQSEMVIKDSTRNIQHFEKAIKSEKINIKTAQAILKGFK